MNQANKTEQTSISVGYKGLCRYVDISRLSAIMRDYPLTYFSEDERKRIAEFCRYIVHLENQELMKMEVR